MSEETSPPELTEEAWADAMSHLSRALERRDFPFEITDRVVYVDRPEGRLSLLMDDLREIVRSSDPERVRSMVNHWIRIGLMRDDVIDLSDFSSVRDRLRIRLYPGDLDDKGQDLAEMRVMDGVRAVLALDLPDSVLALSRSQIEPWGLEEQAAFAMGLHQVVAEPDVTEETLEGPEGGILHVHSGTSHFVASRALALEQWVESKHGALVVVPNRHTLIFHPIVDSRAVTMIQALWMLAEAPFKQGPGPVSREVYWWLPGRFARIEVHADDDSEAFAIRPPDAFRRVIEELPDPAPSMPSSGGPVPGEA